MTPKPSRMDGYIRVSRVGTRAGDSFISPQVQREQIEGWAKLKGVEVAAWHEDLDQSGGKLDRPGLDALLARIEASDTEGVIVAKLDRLSRLGVADALKLVEGITEGGGTIAALDLGIDPTTPTGELMLTLMLAMARMERRRLSDSWDTAKTLAMDRGVKIGPTPLGYQREADGTLSEHPQDGPIVREAYRLAALSGLDAAITYLAREVPSRGWTTSTTRRLLSTRTYLGESHYGDRMERDAHPALTDRLTWERAQTTPQTRRPKADYPLSGIVHCASCGASMVGGRAGKNQRTYRCSASLSRYKGERCPKPANVMAHLLEDYLQEALTPLLDGLSVSVADGGEALAEAEQAMLDAEDELQEFAADLTARRALSSRYHEHLTARAEAAENARRTYRDLAQQTQATERLTGASVLSDPQQIGELLRGTDLLNITVAAGRGKLDGRVRLMPVDG